MGGGVCVVGWEEDLVVLVPSRSFRAAPVVQTMFKAHLSSSFAALAGSCEYGLGLRICRERCLIATAAHCEFERAL
jgi:hypothetical protein